MKDVSIRTVFPWIIGGCAALVLGIALVQNAQNARDHEIEKLKLENERKLEQTEERWKSFPSFRRNFDADTE